MLANILVLIIMLFIASSLASGLIFLIKDKSYSKRMLTALSFRIALSLALCFFLFLALHFGYLSPHGL